MRSHSKELTPAAMILAGRLLGLSLLLLLWLREGRGAEELLFVLFLAVLGLSRWRFERQPSWTLLFDEAACLAATTLWPSAALGLALPLLEAAYAGSLRFALPLLAIIALQGAPGLPLLAAFAAALLLGLGGRSWSRGLESLRLEADGERRERLDLESLKSELVSDNLNSARMAGAAERGRIARELHDHVGYALTAAHLALQAFGILRQAENGQAGDGQAEELLAEAGARVEQGLALLRSTLRGLAPEGEEGLESFEEICRRFAPARVDLEVRGDTDRIPVFAWAVLAPCLKEALSNGTRHGGARSFAVSLDVGPSIVRLAVRSGETEAIAKAGEGPVPAGGGQGLRNLRRRARAVGGNVNVEAAAGFRLVCVLPLDEPAGAPS